MKLCAKCRLNEATEKHTWCSECLRTYAAARRTDPAVRMKHSERETARSKTIAGRRARTERTAKKFGLTVEEYARMLHAQDLKCASCSDILDLSGKKTHGVDHCHKTGRVRGVLCRHCNLLLGQAKDSIERLLLAVKYLQKDAATLRSETGELLVWHPQT